MTSKQKVTQGVHKLLHFYTVRMLITDYTMPNESYETTTSSSTYSLQYNTSQNLNDLTTLVEIFSVCNKMGQVFLRATIQIVIFVLALPANSVLLCVLVKNRKSLSASEVLGLNFALVGVLFCLSLPLDFDITTTNNRSGVPLRIVNSIAMLSYFSCPLLLTSLCLERYVAVAHPVLFMRLGKWEYRAACSAIIWFLTSIMAAVTFVFTLANTALVLSIFANVLFLVMVACLLGIVRVLYIKGPGEGDQNNSAVKMRALKYIISVLVPSTITYLPLLCLVPFLVIAPILVKNGTINLFCNFLAMFAVLPNFGVCIGPLFYMARVKQLLYRRNNKSSNTRDTTVNQRT